MYPIDSWLAISENEWIVFVSRAKTRYFSSLMSSYGTMTLKCIILSIISEIHPSKIASYSKAGVKLPLWFAMKWIDPGRNPTI